MNPVQQAPTPQATGNQAFSSSSSRILESRQVLRTAAAKAITTMAAAITPSWWRREREEEEAKVGVVRTRMRCLAEALEESHTNTSL